MERKRLLCRLKSLAFYNFIRGFGWGAFTHGVHIDVSERRIKANIPLHLDLLSIGCKEVQKELTVLLH